MQRLGLFTLFLSVVAQRDRRQVTYQADGNTELYEPSDDQSVQPMIKKPLPLQVLYPGDLSSFFINESSEESRNTIFNITNPHLSKSPNVSKEMKRRKRSTFRMNKRHENKGRIENPLKYRDSSNIKNKRIVAQESRLHASYHEPSVSIMNDIPVEMSFDGAGFLRHEDDSNEDKNANFHKNRNSGTRKLKVNQDNTQALQDFQAAFNVSRMRAPNQVKYDDEVVYQNQPTDDKTYIERIPDHGAQSTENGAPFAVDFMTAFQHGMFTNPPINYGGQPTQIPQQPTYDPFQFYQSMFSNQAMGNTMMSPTPQQDSFIQNHRVPMLTSPDAISHNAMFTQIPQQVFPTGAAIQTNSAMPTNTAMQTNAAMQPNVAMATNAAIPTNNAYASNINMPQYQKKQRRKRSVSHSEDENGNVDRETSQASQNRFRYSGEEREEASSGFLPITGTFNGGAIQLNFPFYGQSPIHSPMHTVSAYSMPVNHNSPYYRNPSERYYYPSEARRYSYGVLGSGNFEVIRGGVFRNERPQNFHGGYQDSRAPYVTNSYPNFGTTEIIIDGPIQGFQGFDNFPIQLINALSKHSEVTTRPDHYDKENLSV